MMKTEIFILDTSNPDRRLEILNTIENRTEFRVKIIVEKDFNVFKSNILESGIYFLHYTDLKQLSDYKEKDFKGISNAKLIILYTNNWNSSTTTTTTTDSAYNALHNFNNNRICVGSDFVIENAAGFINEFLDSNDLYNSYYHLIRFDQELEKLLKPFEISSPIRDSHWELELNNAKIRLNDYLKNNKQT